MRKGLSRFFRLSALALAFGVSGNAFGDSVKMTGGSANFQASNGGEFNAALYATDAGGVVGNSWADLLKNKPHDLVGGTFQTFCIEHGENVSLPGTYFMQIAPSATLGGGGATGGFDPISKATQWLYRQFRDDTLPGYSDSGASRLVDARALQLAFWVLENEILTTDAEYAGNGAAQAFVTLAHTHDNDTTDYGTRVMRLWTNWSQLGGYTGYAQDQLALVNPGGADVPLPPVAIGGLALFGVFGLKRKFAR